MPQLVLILALTDRSSVSCLWCVRYSFIMRLHSPSTNSDSYLCNCFVHIPPFSRSRRHHRRDTRYIRGPSDALRAFTSFPLTRYPFQAFVIYNFFHLLLAYLGGERSLLILLHGRPPKDHLFPGRYFLSICHTGSYSLSVYIFKHEMDASDPFTFLWLKRGILRVSRTISFVRLL